MTDRAKLNAARLSITAAALLAALKLLTGLATGSMAILSSAVDSLLDILMSGFNYLAIRQAVQPADERHPFGHGKFETLATLVQSLLIGLSGLWIIVESVRRLLRGVSLQRLDQGIGVLLLSVVVSLAVSRHLKRVARRTDSSALQADALHFSMDVYTNLGLMAGLALISFTGARWLDPLLSMLVACYILFEAVRLVRHSLHDVLDAELPPELQRQVTDLIASHRDEVLGYHNLRTRRAGSQKIMDFHLTVCKHLTVEQAHEIADDLEKRIEQALRGSDVTIHVEPCCRKTCPGMAACREERADQDFPFETPR